MSVERVDYTSEEEYQEAWSMEQDEERQCQDAMQKEMEHENLLKNCFSDVEDLIGTYGIKTVDYVFNLLKVWDKIDE